LFKYFGLKEKDGFENMKLFYIPLLVYCYKNKMNMKKLGFLFVMAGVISFGLSSCGDGGGDDDVTLPKPTVSFLAGTGYVSASGPQSAGDSVVFHVDVTGANNLEKLTALVSVSGASQAIFADTNITTLKQKNFKWIVVYHLPSSPNTKVDFVFKATMKDGNEGSNNLSITTQAPPRTLTSRNNIEIGAQANTLYGSFINLDTVLVKFLVEANAMGGNNIDGVFFIGGANGASLVSPDDASATTYFSGISGWSKRKATRFSLNPFTASEFDAMTTSTELDKKVSAATAKSVANLKVGDVILFRTEGNINYGLIKVVSVSSQTNGTMAFDIKIPN
jgi:hypothetical protein